MFFPGSRYLNLGTTQTKRSDGTVVVSTILPLPTPAPLLGYHRRLEGQRLDLIAQHYLADATAFWRLADANNTVVPDVLATRALVGIPAAPGS
jgi:hypothetical protein